MAGGVNVLTRKPGVKCLRPDSQGGSRGKLAGAWRLGWILLLAPWLPGHAAAQEILLREGEAEPTEGTFTVPFVFFSDSMGAAAGASVGRRGYIQPF
jgi:hypothetical protein